MSTDFYLDDPEDEREVQAFVREERATELQNPWEPDLGPETPGYIGIDTFGHPLYEEQVVTTTATSLDGDRRIGVEYRVGDEVEVLNGGLGTWQPATISAIRGWGFEVLTGKPEQARLAFIYQVRRAR